MSTITPLNSQKQATSGNSLPASAQQAAPLMRLEAISYQVNGQNSNRRHSNRGHKLKCNWLSGTRSAEQAKSSMTQTALQKILLTNINLQILPYEKVSIIGPNGAGKSTLMKLILGLISPTTGKISRHSTLNIGYVPQKFSVPPILPLRVQDLLAQTKTALTSDQLDFLYNRLSIYPLLNKQVIHLSGGETQRVLLARSFLTKPNLLILDEPMQGLDPESERWLYEFIDSLPDFLQCAMVVVSHDLHWVMRGSRRVICLNKHICCEGQPSDIGISQEFQKLFGHQYELPYIHQPHECQHLDPHQH